MKRLAKLNKDRIAERDGILRIFEEWHLNTFFEPFDCHLVIHVARWQGFLGATKLRQFEVER